MNPTSSVSSNDPLADWELEIQKYLNFLVESDKKEDLIAVLRAHLYLEIGLSSLLLANNPKASLNQRDGFDAKLKQVEAGGLLDAGEIATFRAINNLRNRFAHLPIKHDVDADDIYRLEAALPLKFSNAVADYPAKNIYREHGLETPSGKVRIILIMLFNWLLSRAAHERDQTAT
jgi:hypothetical protein